MDSNRQLFQYLQDSGALTTPSLIEAFQAVDRSDFVPGEVRPQAYADRALPIGHGQTISQPSVVAFMLELLAPKKGERVLDVGSGSGWTTALLAYAVGPSGIVRGVERIPELAVFGTGNLSKYNFPHASITEADATLGAPNETPFDAILVSAAAWELPYELLSQLAVGGTLVAPVKDAVCKIRKPAQGYPRERDIERHYGFAFVPLITSGDEENE